MFEAKLFFYSALTIVFLYTILKKRYFDIFTIAVFCSIYYSSPIFFEEIFDPTINLFVLIDVGIYVIYGLLFLFLFLFMVLFDFKNIKQINNNLNGISYNSYFYILFILIFSVFISMLVKNPTFLFDTGLHKADLSQFGFISAVFVWGSLILVSLSLFNKNKKQLYLSMFLIMITLFIGSRSYFATAILMVFIIMINTKGRQRLIFQTKYILFGMITFTFLFVFKLFYVYLRIFDFNAIYNVLSDNTQYLYRVFQGGEANLIMVNLQKSIEGYVGFQDAYLQMLFLRLIPFLSREIGSVFDIHVETYINVLTTNYYSQISYGMGSSFWGEMYYIGGFITVFLSIILYMIILYVGNYYISVKKNVFIIFLFPALVYIAFYIHRIEFAFAIYSFYICVAFYFLIKFARLLLKRQKRVICN